MILNSLSTAPLQVKSKTIAVMSALLVVLTLVLAACGGSSHGSSSKHVLNIATQSYDFAQAGFNPYNGHPNAGAAGLIYETLEFVNVNDGTFTPMLATGYSWGAGYKQLTFTIRPGVHWNDGQAFSAKDVAFTFNEMKQYPAADTNGVWSYLSSVTAKDANTVVMTFQKPYPPELVTLAGHVYIIPQHIFASAGDPTRYLSDHPVGTGPFKLKSYQPNIAVYDKNPGKG